MKTLNAQQLAFILDIKKRDARLKIVFAWAKSKGQQPNAVDEISCPERLDIETLAIHLNLPDLQLAADDIENNYLVRPSSKKYILLDYPESEIKKIQAVTVKYKHISLPPALRSMISETVQQEIKRYWKQKYPDYA